MDSWRPRPFILNKALISLLFIFLPSFHIPYGLPSYFGILLSTVLLIHPIFSKYEKPSFITGQNNVKINNFTQTCLPSALG